MDWTELANAPWIGALAGAAVVVLGLLFGLRRGARKPLAIARQPAVLGPEERRLYVSLRHIAGADVHVWPRLRASDVLAVRRSAGRRQRRRARGHIAGEHFDFVLCARSDSRPLAVVRIEPRSPARGERRRAEAVAHACATAGVGLVRLTAGGQHDEEALGEELRPHLEAPAEESVTATADGGRREPIIDLPPD